MHVMLVSSRIRLFSSGISLSVLSLHNRCSSNCSFSGASCAMGTNSASMIFLCGKSTAETEIAKSLKISNVLKLPDGGEVSAFLQPEINDFRFDEEAFNVDLFMNSLSTNKFVRFLVWSPRLSSTHDIVSHNFCELPVGAVCAADLQFKGRGRSKNAWESPRGCLMFSFTLQMDNGKIVPLVQYVVSLAVTEAIKDVCDRNGLPCLDVRIKWPNDLYLNGLKVGGVLCTSTYKSKKFNVSSGIGLNVDNEKPTTSLNAALKELCATSNGFKREDFLAAFFNKFELLYDAFINQGFQTLEELYYITWLHSGQRVIVQEKNEDTVVENVVTIQGLTSSGHLLATGDDYQMYELHPDGNRFTCPIVSSLFVQPLLSHCSDRSDQNLDHSSNKGAERHPTNFLASGMSFLDENKKVLAIHST